MMRAILSVLLISNCFLSNGQYFQFSQFNYAPQRINPATVAASDYASADFIYRRQATDGGITLNTNLLNASYPLISKNNKRWSGVGISLMHDQAGPAGIFSATEVALSYALNIHVARYQSLSLGFKALHSSRRVSIDGFFTGLQFIPERGFDPGLESGESFHNLNSNFLTFSSGIWWQSVDKKGNTRANFGLSFFDFNNADESFIGAQSPYPGTLVTSLRFTAFKQQKISLLPEMLYTLNAGKGKINAGLVTSYELRTFRNKPSERIDFHTKYLSGKMVMVGIQICRERFSMGLSYDFALSKNNVNNTGTTEIALGWRQLVKKSRGGKRKTPIRTTKATNTVKKSTAERHATDSIVVENSLPQPGTTAMAQRIEHKRDSVEAIGKAGNIKHESLILEKTDLRFNFQFNSSELDGDAQKFLDDVAEILINNEDLRIELTGHTDNIGSGKFNQKLSETRANTIREYLLSKGVAESKVESSGKGATEPLNDNSSEEDRAANRRVEMKIVYDF